MPRFLRNCLYLSGCLFLAATAACVESGTQSTGTEERTGESVDAGTAQPDAATSEVGPGEVDAVQYDLGFETGVIDAVSDPIVVPRFETGGDEFYRMPWPNDYRRTSEGTVDLSDFPNGSNETVSSFVTTIEAEVSGFSAMPVVYVELTGAPEQVTLPSPGETLESTASIQLIDVTGSNCGVRTPLELTYRYAGDNYRADRLLSAAPVVGFPLAPDHTYVFVMTTDFGLTDGFETFASPEMDALLSGEHGDSRLTETFDPAWSCLDSLSMDRDSLALVTVFTTQDPVFESRLLREQVMNSDRVPSPTITTWEALQDDEEKPYYSCVGTYETPIYQRGQSPYANSGGGLVFDDDGNPVIQRWEEVPFVVSWPREGEGPFPVLVWVDGTGASLLGHRRKNFSKDAIAAGFAIASFSPQFHGDRAVPGSDDALHTFNYINPESGRTVFRQQAVDTSYFIRVLREAVPDTATDQPELQTDQLVYGGHSQGALVGALLAGLEGELEAYYLNGIGSWLSETILERKDPADIAALLVLMGDVEGDVDVYHPLVQLAQLGSDTVDSYNYARYWPGWDDHTSGSHVFISNGYNDHTTPPRGIGHITIAGDLTPVEPAGWDVDPYGLWSQQSEATPISGNRQSLAGTALTMASYLNAETGHYTVYDDEHARALAINFLRTALDGVPTVGLE